MKQLKGNRKKTLISANDDNKRKYKSLEKILEFAFFQKKVLSLHKNDIIRVTTMSLKSNSEA